MISEAIREARRRSIGCSDIAGIVIDPGTGKAVSPWQTPYTVWRSKNFHEDQPETPQMRFGSVAEAFVADEYMRAHPGTRLFNYGTTLRKGWLTGNIDRAVQRPGDEMPIRNGQLITKVGLEIKTSGELAPWLEVPLHYKLQEQGYLYLCETAEAWELMVMYRATMKFDEFRDERDPAFERNIVPYVEAWADRYIGHFDPDDPPPATCEDDCKAEWLRRKPDLVSIPVDDRLYDVISQLKAAEAAKKEAEAKAKVLREAVILEMANAANTDGGRGAEAVIGYDGKPLCTYKAPKPTVKTDYEAAVKEAVAQNLITADFVGKFRTETQGAPRFLGLPRRRVASRWTRGLNSSIGTSF